MVGLGDRWFESISLRNKSMPATAEQMVRLVLKGSNQTFDSLLTDTKADSNSFNILANTFKTRIQQPWDKKYLKSFGLVSSDGRITNAGALFADDCPLMQSRLYCTRWYGKDKSDAINDAEYTGNILPSSIPSPRALKPKSITERRNPILANVMAQLEYMEKRGSGLTRICNETRALDGYKEELHPAFLSTPTQFQTIIFAFETNENVGEHVGDLSDIKLTERQQNFIALVKSTPTLSAKQMSETLSVSSRTIERDLAALKSLHILSREGKDNDGIWIVTDIQK